MTRKIMRLPQVKERTGLSRSSIYAFMKANQFPASISLGIRSVGWIEESIDNWIDARVKGGRGNNV